MDKPIERRSLALRDVEFRDKSATGEASFVGYGAVFNQPTQISDWLGEYRETIAPGAFKRALADQQSVPLLINHDAAAIPLARFPGTMTLSEDKRGLRVEASLDPASPAAASAISALRRKDLRAMSFSFRAVQEDWTADYGERTVRAADLYDVAIVTTPAYPGAEAGLRSEDSAQARAHAIIAAQRSGRVLSGANVALLKKAKKAVKAAGKHLNALAASGNAPQSGGKQGLSGDAGGGQDSGLTPGQDGMGPRNRVPAAVVRANREADDLLNAGHRGGNVRVSSAAIGPHAQDVAGLRQMRAESLALRAELMRKRPSKRRSGEALFRHVALVLEEAQRRREGAK